MYDNNYISSSQDMHNYLDQLSGLEPVFRKNISRSSECENQYTKPFRLSKISKSTKHGYERDYYQKDKKVIEWKKSNLDDNSEEISKKCLPNIRDPRLKTSMVGFTLPFVNNPDKSMYNLTVKCKKKVPTAETGKRCDDGTDNPEIIQMSKGRKPVTSKMVELKRIAFTEPSTTATNKSLLKCNIKEDTANPNAEDVSKKHMDNSNQSRKHQPKCIKIKVFPPLSKVDYENIWIKKAKVVLSEIPCSIRKKYKLKIVNKTTEDSKHTVSQSVQTDLYITKPSPEDADSLKTDCEYPKQKRDRESFLSSMEKELDDTKKLTSSTNCASIWVDPKVMSMSETLQKACNTNSNASTLAFKLKESPKSPEKGVTKKGHLFDLDKLRNSLQGTMNSSKNLMKSSSKVSETVFQDKSRNDERMLANLVKRNECKDDFQERRTTRTTLRQSVRDQETQAVRNNSQSHKHNLQKNPKPEHRQKHKQSKLKLIDSSHVCKQSSDSLASLSIQYPQISSTNDSTSIPEEKEPITLTRVKDDVQDRKPTSRWDIRERSNRKRKAPDGKNDFKLQKSYSSLDKASRIISDSRPKRNRTKLISSTSLIQDQDQENYFMNVSIEPKSNTNNSYSEDKKCMSHSVPDKDHNISTTNDVASDENILLPNALKEKANSEDTLTVKNNCDQSESSSLELRTSVICMKSPISSEFLDQEVNEFALESFVSEVEVETTVVEDTVLEHASVSCALVTQTPVWNQIPDFEHSQTLVQKISACKMSLSELILADTSHAYRQEKVFLQSNKEACKTSDISDTSSFVDEDNQQSLISNEIGSVHQTNCEVKIIGSVDTVSNISVEHCNITICESELVTSELIGMDQNENSLKILEDPVNGKSSLMLGSNSREDYDQQMHDSEISKTNEIDQQLISNISNSQQMEDSKESTNIQKDDTEQTKTCDQFHGPPVVVDKPPNKGDNFNPAIQEEVVVNANEIYDTESSCDKEKIEGIGKLDEEGQNTSSISESLDKNISNQNASSSEEYPQPVGNNSNKNVMFTLSKSVLYEDISNSSISEDNVPSPESKIEENEFNILQESIDSDVVAENSSSQNINGDLVDEKSNQCTPVSREKAVDPNITLIVSPFPSETSLSSTNEPGSEKSQPVAEVPLSEINSLSVAEDLVQIGQPGIDPNLLSINDAAELQLASTNLYPKDREIDTESMEDIIQKVHETAGSNFEVDKPIDVSQNVHEFTNGLPDTTTSNCAEMNDVSIENKNSEVQAECTSLPDQTQDSVSSNNITMIVDDNSLDGCSRILITKIDEESDSSSFSDLPDSENKSECRSKVEKKLIEIKSAEIPFLEFVKNYDKNSKTIKSDQFKTLKVLKPNELDIANQKYFYEGCPLFYIKSLCVNEGMKLPVRIATNDYYEVPTTPKFQETEQIPRTETIGMDNNLSKQVSETTRVCADINSAGKHELSNETILDEAERDNTENEVAPTEANSITTKSESMATQLQPELTSPLCLKQVGTQRPCSTYLPPGANIEQTSKLTISRPEIVPTTPLQPGENGEIPIPNESLTNHSSHMISHPLSGGLPSLAQRSSISTAPFSVESFSTQIATGRPFASAKTNKCLPQSITTNSIVRPIVSIKRFDTALPTPQQKPLDKGLLDSNTNNVTEKLLRSDSSDFTANNQLSPTNQSVVFGSENYVTVKDSEEQEVSSSEVHSTNIVTFPLELPVDSVTSLTLSDSSFGTILKISETVKSSDDISKPDGVNETISNRCVEGRHEMNKESDIPGCFEKIINSEFCIEQHAKAKPNNLEIEEVNSKVDQILALPNSDRNPKTALTRELDHNNPHIHISIPLSRIECSHIPAKNLVIYPSPASSTLLVASESSSASSSDRSPPKLSPAIELTNLNEDVEVEGADALSDCGSANTDETQVWKKGSSLEETMSDETLIYSCDELEDIDQELILNEKLKSEKQKILKVVQKLRQELSENKIENNDILIRKRRRSEVLESLADTESGLQKSNEDSCLTQRAVQKAHKSRGSWQKQKFRKKKELNNEVLYDSDLDELPVIHPPKRRRLQKLNMQETAIRSNLDSERIRLELPLHNWLEHKIKLGTESTKSSNEDVQEESGLSNETVKKKSEKNLKKVKQVPPDTKPKESKDSKDLKDSDTSKALSKESDGLPNNTASSATPFLKTSSTETSEVWRQQLALSRSKLQSKEKENKIDNKQAIKDAHENNVEVIEPVLSSTPLECQKFLQPVQEDNTNLQSPQDDVSATLMDRDENLEDGQLVVDDTSTSQKKSDQNVPSLQKMEDTDTKKKDSRCEFELHDSTEKEIEEEMSRPDLNNQTYNLTSNISDASQPLDLCLKVSQDTQIKPVSQKPQPKVQLVHPQVISPTAKKKEEPANLMQTTKMAIQSITSTRMPIQNECNSSNETSIGLNQDSQVNVGEQVEVCDYSMKVKSNTNMPSEESHESSSNCLPETSDHERTLDENTSASSGQNLHEDLEFQHHIEELRHLERLARKKEQEHAQVLALSRKKVETIMKLKLQKKRAAALNLSTVTFDEEREVQPELSARNSSPGSSSSDYLASNTMPRNENSNPLIGDSAAETKAGINLAKKEDNTTTSNDSHSKINVGLNKEDKSEELKTVRGIINEAVLQAVQNKTIKNPISENEKQITPQPAHQRVKSTLPYDEPCKLPNDASSLCPFRLRSDSLTDPSINPTKKSIDKPIQEAHNQPAFQSAGCLIVPKITNSQKESLGYNYPGVNESNKSRTSGYKRTQSSKKEDELNKQNNEVIDLTIDTYNMLSDPPPLKRIKRDQVIEKSHLQNKSPLNNPHIAYDESSSRQILRSPNQRLTATCNGQEVIQPVPRYQTKASSYSHSPPVYQQNMVHPTATSPVQNRLHYDRNSPYSRGASPNALYSMRLGMPNPLMRLPNVQTFNPQIRPEQQMQKHQAPFPPVPQNNPYGHLEPGEIITSRFSRGWQQPFQLSAAAPNQHMPEVAERRMFPGQHGVSPHVMKQIMAQHLAQQKLSTEQSHHPNGPPGPYRTPPHNVTQKVFSPHGMTQPFQEPMQRSNEIQQYSGNHIRPVTSIIDNNRACCVCNKVSCFICSGCRKVWYCSYQCQNANWKVHSQHCKKP